MRRGLCVVVVLLAAGCASSPAAGRLEAGPVRLLIAGVVELSDTAAAVAGSDSEGVFREIRLLVRRADWALVIAADADAEALLAATGFDAVACPRSRRLAGVAPMPVGSRCWQTPGPPTTSSPASPDLAVGEVHPLFRPAGAEVVAAAAGAPFVAISRPFGGRACLTVSGLGALLSGDPSSTGVLLEALTDRGGVIAYRVGRVTHADFRVHFADWELPTGDAVLLEGDWWALVRPGVLAPVVRPPALNAFDQGQVVAAAVGDVTGDGYADLAVSYRHPFRPTALSEAYDGAVGVDSLGRSAHLGVFTKEGEPLWAAGYIPRPVGDLAACHGSVALAYTALDDPAVVATGAAVWQGLSLRPAPELPGPGAPGCADVDGDGDLDPVILGRAG